MFIAEVLENSDILVFLMLQSELIVVGFFVMDNIVYFTEQLGTMAPSEFLARLNLGTVRDTIEEILHEPKLLAAAATSSYAHANGFDKIPLFYSREQYRIRLHIWWPEAKTTVEDIHNHRWDFSSKVLTGELDFENYIEKHDGEPKHEYQYFPRENNDFFSMRYVSLCGLESVFRCNLKAGSSYSIAHGQLHRAASNSGNLTSTIMVQMPATERVTRVFTDKIIQGAERMDSPSFTEKELEQKLRHYLLLTKSTAGIGELLTGES